MSYKHHKVIGIRKVKWDMLWHILYEIKDLITHKTYETWDRVSKEEALNALKLMK